MSIDKLMECTITKPVIIAHTDSLSPSGHGVASIPIRVLYSHAGPVGTAEDLSSQTTKSSDHVKGQVIQTMCKVT